MDFPFAPSQGSNSTTTITTLTSMPTKANRCTTVLLPSSIPRAGVNIQVEKTDGRERCAGVTGMLAMSSFIHDLTFTIMNGGGSLSRGGGSLSRTIAHDLHHPKVVTGACLE